MRVWPVQAPPLQREDERPSACACRWPRAWMVGQHGSARGHACFGGRATWVAEGGRTPPHSTRPQGPASPRTWAATPSVSPSGGPVPPPAAGCSARCTVNAPHSFPTTGTWHVIVLGHPGRGPAVCGHVLTQPRPPAPRAPRAPRGNSGGPARAAKSFPAPAPPHPGPRMEGAL